MDTKEKAALALLKKLGYKISKTNKKSIAPELMNGAFGEAAASIIKTKNLTIRKIFLKAIKSKFFDACLDTLFKGTKRAAFDDKEEKLWTSLTATQDIFVTLSMIHSEKHKILQMYDVKISNLYLQLQLLF